MNRIYLIAIPTASVSVAEVSVYAESLVQVVAKEKITAKKLI
jgi:hypothetical protein